MFKKTNKKETNTIEDQREKQIKAIEKLGKQLVEFNDFNTNKADAPIEKQKEIANKLLKENPYEFHDLNNSIYANNLICEYKPERRSSKHFRHYQNLIELFRSLRNGDVNPKEILKNQMNFKSYLGETETGGNKSEYRQATIKNISNFFWFRKQKYFLYTYLYRDYSSLLSEPKYKAIYEEEVKILTPKQIFQRWTIVLA